MAVYHSTLTLVTNARTPRAHIQKFVFGFDANVFACTLSFHLIGDWQISPSVAFLDATYI